MEVALGRRQYVVERLRRREYFDPRSFRYKKAGEHRVLVGCKRGKWDAKRKVCKVSTEVYEILHPKGEKTMSLGEVYSLGRIVRYYNPRTGRYVLRDTRTGRFVGVQGVGLDLEARRRRRRRRRRGMALESVGEVGLDLEARRRRRRRRRRGMALESVGEVELDLEARRRRRRRRRRGLFGLGLEQERRIFAPVRLQTFVMAGVAGTAGYLTPGLFKRLIPQLQLKSDVLQYAVDGLIILVTGGLVYRFAGTGPGLFFVAGGAVNIFSRLLQPLLQRAGVGYYRPQLSYYRPQLSLSYYRAPATVGYLMPQRAYGGSYAGKTSY